MIREHVPEGNTIIFEAPQRWGKTLAMVIWALDSYQRGRTVFSNIQLGFPHSALEFGEIKLTTAAGGRSPYWNGHIAIDELNFYFDGRRSLQKENIDFSAFLLQQKKQGCHLTGTTHDLESLDVRLRMNYDYVIRPKCYPIHPAAPQILKMDIENGPLQARFRRSLTLDCQPYLGLYDSFAVYDPFKNRGNAKAKRPDVLL
jgi:hypothetical protein